MRSEILQECQYWKLNVFSKASSGQLVPRMAERGILGPIILDEYTGIQKYFGQQYTNLVRHTYGTKHAVKRISIKLHKHTDTQTTLANH